MTRRHPASSANEQRIAELRLDLRRLENQARYDASLRGDLAYIRAEIRRLENKPTEKKVYPAQQPTEDTENTEDTTRPLTGIWRDKLERWTADQ